MFSFTEPGKIIVTCSKRLSKYVQVEIVMLGFRVDRVFATGVELTGTMSDCIRLNLNLRCASQVLFSLRSFPCNNPDELYDEISKIAWETIFAKDGYFAVKSIVDDPSINNSLFVNVKVKDAIVDRFRKTENTRPDSGHDLQATVLTIFWREGVAEIFIDTSGETLSKHGYRKIPGKAPMLESLAAATILATVWDKKSAFINPMCGSSTVAIEAALIATNRAPGLYWDNYGFKHISGFDEGYYQKEKGKLSEQVIDVPSLQIIASDISEDAINVSKINAAVAGVEQFIDFSVCDFRDTKIPEENKGVVYLNPEYGERMGNVSELTETYRAVGDFLKTKCKGYMGYVFTGNLDLSKKIGLKAKRKIEFYTSKIDCRLLEYELYEGSKRIVKPLPRI